MECSLAQNDLSPGRQVRTFLISIFYMRSFFSVGLTLWSAQEGILRRKSINVTLTRLGFLPGSTRTANTLVDRSAYPLHRLGARWSFCCFLCYSTMVLNTQSRLSKTSLSVPSPGLLRRIWASVCRRTSAEPARPLYRGCYYCASL